MENLGLVKTKVVIPPLTSSLIERPGLIKKMTEGEHKKLTTIVAPAGYGKSTLLIMWAAQIKDTAAWISLDKEDNDPGVFLRYLLASVTAVWPDFGRTLTSLILSPALFEVLK